MYESFIVLIDDFEKSLSKIRRVCDKKGNMFSEILTSYCDRTIIKYAETFVNDKDTLNIEYILICISFCEKNFTSDVLPDLGYDYDNECKITDIILDIIKLLNGRYINDITVLAYIFSCTNNFADIPDTRWFELNVHNGFNSFSELKNLMFRYDLRRIFINRLLELDLFSNSKKTGSPTKQLFSKIIAEVLEVWCSNH